MKWHIDDALMHDSQISSAEEDQIAERPSSYSDSMPIPKSGIAFWIHHARPHGERRNRASFIIIVMRTHTRLRDQMTSRNNDE